MKRKAAIRRISRKKKRIKRALKGKKKTYTTPSGRRQVVFQEPTPPGTGRRLFRGAVNTGAAVGSLVTANPMVGIGIEAAGQAMEIGYDALTQTGPKSRASTSGSGFVSGGGGKMRMFKKKRSKNPSIVALQKKGITYNAESRKVATTADAEAIAVGHTSMPAKVCAINMWRAVIKHVLIKAGILVKDFGNLMTDDFVISDEIHINRYTSNLATSVATDIFVVAANWTYDTLCATIAALYDDASALGDDRFDSIELVPKTTSKVQALQVELNNLKITCFTKSVLKIQNVTSDTATDNEADDINRVPLVGKQYLCKGNNFVVKSNGKMLEGLFDQFNEEALYGGWTKQAPSFIGGTSVSFYSIAAGPSNSTETTFTKPSEPPRIYEIQNCFGAAPLVLNPGQIHQSQLVQKYTMSLPFYIQMLYANLASSNTAITYNEKLGKTSIMYLEKAVGRGPVADNAIKVWTELELRQSVLVHGAASNFTLPLQFQRDF